MQSSIYKELQVRGDAFEKARQDRIVRILNIIGIAFVSVLFISVLINYCIN
jgi:hypothetical protein